MMHRELRTKKISHEVVAEAANRGMELVADETLASDSTTAGAQAARIKAAHADAIICWVTGAAFGTLLRSLNDAGVDIPIVTTGANSNETQMKQYAAFLPTELILPGFPYNLGEEALRKTTLGSATGPFFQAFRDASATPSPAASPYVWDLAQIVLSAYQKLGFNATPLQMRDYIGGIRHFVGINGFYDFSSGDQHGLSSANTVFTHWNPKTNSFDPISGTRRETEVTMTTATHAEADRSRGIAATTDALTSVRFIEDGWYAVAFSTELGDEIVERTILDKRVILYRTAAGVAVMLDGLCPHRQYPLALGQRLGDEVQCGYHGITFGSDGTCTRIPGQNRIPPALCVRRYATVERGGWIWAWLGNPAHSQVELIPEEWLGDSGWAATQGMREVNARSQLILENLMDLSHETFIHSTSIGNREVAEAPITTEVNGNIVRGSRIMKGVPVAPAHAAWGAVGPVDRDQIVEFFPPSFVVVHGQVVDANRLRLRWKTLHAITPITANVSRYQFALVRDFALDQDWSTTKSPVISEDVAALEAQERSLVQTSRPLAELSVEADAAALQMRRVLRRLPPARSAP